MTINGISGVNMQAGQMGIGQADDPYSKQIKQQIADAQKQLQELFSNQDMTAEEKMKKRQELQKKISDLNMQLKQHQVELRREKQQEKGPTMDDMLGNTKNTVASKNNAKADAGISQANMTAMISADSSMKMAKVQGSVATGMEGKAGVLEAEIKLDASRGEDVSKKQEELADVKKKAEEATSSQLSTLADANKKLEEAAGADQTAMDKTDDKKVNGQMSNDQSANKADDEDSAAGNAAPQDEDNAGNISESEDAATGQQTMVYHPVDIRL